MFLLATAVMLLSRHSSTENTFGGARASADCNCSNMPLWKCDLDRCVELANAYKATRGILNLSSCGLRGTIPQQVGQLIDYLPSRTIDLSDNQLTGKIPDLGDWDDNDRYACAPTVPIRDKRTHMETIANPDPNWSWTTICSTAIAYPFSFIGP